ncbi:hypothetical protein [Paenibacillus sp. LK1]|nr:hypothetical protein [Paenibacillus sp. LK1]
MKVKQCCITEVIKVVVNKGTGTNEDPVREVTQYWGKDGKKIAEIDPTN